MAIFSRHVSALIGISFAITAGPVMAGSLSDGAVAYAQGHYAVALQLLQPVAEDGEPIAQMFLGMMYQQGQGVPRNNLHAYGWFSQAMLNFDQESADFRNATKGRDDVAKSMTGAETKVAEDAAQRCHASHYKNCD